VALASAVDGGNGHCSDGTITPSHYPSLS
jgi:hypothetical protein